MGARRQVMIRAGLWVVAGVCAMGGSAVAQPPAAASLCTRLAAQMRASPATVLKDRVVPHLQPWIVNASSQPAQADPAYRQLPSEWRTMGGDGASFPTIATLPGTDLAMISAYAGSGDCLASQFFERRPGGAVHLVQGAPIGEDLCSRDGRWGEFASVLGVPAFMAYGSLNPDNQDALLIIAPWRGTAWGRACPLSIRFTYRYLVTPLYCSASAPLCAAARKVAPDVKRRFHAWSVSDIDAFNDYGGAGPKFRYGPAPDAQERALVARARQLGFPKRLVLGRHIHHAWLQHLRPFGTVYFPLKLAGAVYVGTATRTAWRNPPYRHEHWLFIVFRSPDAGSHRLVPLAAFTVRRITGGVRSIEARNESVSVNQRNSTSLPAL